MASMRPEVAKAIGAIYRRLDFVYVVKLDDGIYKIGMTSNITRRMEQLKGNYHVKRVVLIHKFRAVRCRSAENWLHSRYHNRNINPKIGRYPSNHNELFALTEKDIAQIKKIVFFDGSKFITGGVK